LKRIAVVAGLVLAVCASTPAAAVVPPDGGGGGGTTIKKVKRLKPWKADLHYRVQQRFSLRTEQSREAPRMGPMIAKGTWLKIECQRYVATPAGRELWLKVAGGWAPDSVMKTYTDGRLRGSPTCRVPHPHHVWVKKRWRKSHTYRITEAQSPQREPRLGTGLGTVVERGQWVRIVCQTIGQKVRGSRLWNRVGVGGYIPDSTMKTYTDGRLPRAPRCKNVRRQPPKFVALGDSYSSGLGGDGYFPASNPRALQFRYDYLEGEPPGRVKDCYRNRHAYSRILARRQKTRRRYVFLACQGDQTPDVRDKQIPVMPDNTQLVTLTIGGNDMGFSDIVARCATAGADCSAAVAEHFGSKGEKLADLGRKLDEVYWKLRAKAPYATVIVLGYPQLFAPAGSVSGCGGIDAEDARLLNRAGALVNQTIQQAVGRHQNFRFVSLGRLFKGHGMCRDLGPGMWINPLTPAGNRKIFSAHPNLRGHRVIANAVTKAAPDLFG
jgi:hypothetical protein